MLSRWAEGLRARRVQRARSGRSQLSDGLRHDDDEVYGGEVSFLRLDSVTSLSFGVVEWDVERGRKMKFSRVDHGNISRLASFFWGRLHWSRWGVVVMAAASLPAALARCSQQCTALTPEKDPLRDLIDPRLPLEKMESKHRIGLGMPILSQPVPIGRRTSTPLQLTISRSGPLRG